MFDVGSERNAKPTGPRLKVPHCGAFEDYVDASDVVPMPHLSAFLAGDSHVALDGVVGLPDDATPAECLDALHAQVSALMADSAVGHGLKEELRKVMEVVG